MQVYGLTLDLGCWDHMVGMGDYGTQVPPLGSPINMA